MGVGAVALGGLACGLVVVLVLGRSLGETSQNALAQTQQCRGVGQLAFEAIGECGKAGADVADDLGLREVDLLHRRRRDADMDHLRAVMAHQERWLLDGVMADRNDQVGLVDGLVHPIPLRQRRRAHVEIGAGIDGPLAHLGIEERNLASPHERRQRLGQLRAACRGAQHHERLLGGHDHGRGAINRR